MVYLFYTIVTIQNVNWFPGNTGGKLRRDDIVSQGNLAGKLSLLSHGHFHSNYGINIYIYIYILYIYYIK